MLHSLTSDDACPAYMHSMLLKSVAHIYEELDCVKHSAYDVITVVHI